MSTRYCPPYSLAPAAWKKGARESWTCLGCNRTGLQVRHRHVRWPPPLELPVYGERQGARREIVAHALISPIDAYLKRYIWRINLDGYVYRKTFGRSVYIHRQILGLEHGNKLEGHHKDDNPLNNQRWNLEIVTRSENERLKHNRNVRVRTLPLKQN